MKGKSYNDVVVQRLDTNLWRMQVVEWDFRLMARKCKDVNM